MPCVRAALDCGRVDATEASGALAAVLQALRAHGQHDANQAALLQLAVQVLGYISEFTLRKELN